MNNQETVLILGGSGLLGHHCYEELKSDFKVIQTYNTKSLSGVNSEYFSVEEKDKLKTILSRYKPKVVINTIALVTVDGCESDKAKADSLNSIFVSDLVEMMEKTGLSDSHLFQISSASVYGIKDNDVNPCPWVETDPAKPISVYADTKLRGEVHASNHQGLVSILRTDFFGINPYSEKSLLWWIINRAKGGKVMDGWENIHFSPVSARKLSEIIHQMIKKGIEGVFNVGCMNECNKYDFASKVCELIGVRGNVKKTSLVQGTEMIRPDFTVLNSSKLGQLIEMNFTWEEDLSLYIRDLPEFPNR